MRPYLRPTAPIAADVLLPAEPGLAMELAQRLLDKPLMANHHHGLWGYSGRTAEGRELTVQATGIGAPSAGAVLAELAGHGVRRVIRLGTCAALDPALRGAEPIVVASALGADGTSAAFGAGLTRPDAELARLLAEGARQADIVSFDLGAEAGPAMREAWSAAGIAAVDLETAALLALAERLGLTAAALVAVAETADRAQADEGAVREALLELGGRAVAALATDTPMTNVNLPAL